MTKLLRLALVAGLIAHYHVLARPAPQGGPPELEAYEDGIGAADSYQQSPQEDTYGDDPAQGNDMYDSQYPDSNLQDDGYDNTTAADDTSARFDDDRAGTADQDYNEGDAGFQDDEYGAQPTGGDPTQDSNGNPDDFQDEYSPEGQNPEYGDTLAQDEYATSPGAASPGTQPAANPSQQQNPAPSLQINGAPLAPAGRHPHAPPPPPGPQTGPSQDVSAYLSQPSSDMAIYIGLRNPQDSRRPVIYRYPIVDYNDTELPGHKLPYTKFPLRMCVNSTGSGYAEMYIPAGAHTFSVKTPRANGAYKSSHIVQCKGFSDQHCGRAGGSLVMELAPYSPINTDDQTPPTNTSAVSINSIFCALTPQKSPSIQVQSHLILSSDYVQLFPVELLPDDNPYYQRVGTGLRALVKQRVKEKVKGKVEENVLSKARQLGESFANTPILQAAREGRRAYDRASSGRNHYGDSMGHYRPAAVRVN